MIMFWIIAIAMVAVALVFLLRPLLRELNKNDVDRTAQNVAITKERLNELKVELEQETITQTEYEQTKEELEQALLNDVEDSIEESNQLNNQSLTHIARYIVIISVPVIALSLYFILGQPDLIEGGKKQVAVPAGHNSASNGNAGLGSIDEMLAKLEAKLKQNPNNAEGWFLLARSYMSMNKYKEAVVALEKTNQLIPNNPVVMLRYADALTMLNGGQISGKPFELIKKAVAIKPDDPTGLWLIGMGYAEQGEYQRAISYWNLLLPLLKDDKSINEVQKLISQAKSKSGIAVTDEDVTKISSLTKKKSIASLKVNVSIDPAKLKTVSMNDTVFIFAKAVSGPPMPLAVVRKQVKDLPIEVVLDDSMAMIPSMRLSSFDKVKITARVSKTGKPLLQKGDVYSKEKFITLPYKDLVQVTIDSIAE
ncbi:MAG TPA: c-type cytochrome biogenesis protein CcmI [Gammaproteobacteria bacterium]|nr:c-type cytochrome biogenesis protein CcmI [Gammaproteobacteria bacterium]